MRRGGPKMYTEPYNFFKHFDLRHQCGKPQERGT
jgi:hypothetical protein